MFSISTWSTVDPVPVPLAVTLIPAPPLIYKISLGSSAINKTLLPGTPTAILLNSSLCPLPAPVYAIVKVSPVMEVEIPVPPVTVNVSVPLLAVVVPESAVNV